MSRIVDAPIEVTLGPDGAGGTKPTLFIFRGGRHRISEVLDTWLMNDRPWWEDPLATKQGPSQIRVWRVRTTQGGIYELTQSGTVWKLYKAYD